MPNFDAGHLTEPELQDLPSRVAYDQSFVDFSPLDGRTICACRPLFEPQLPTLARRIYAHLISYDMTAQAFLRPESDHAYDQGTRSEQSMLEELAQEHPYLREREESLQGYYRRILNNADWGPTSPVWVALDSVAERHIGRSETPLYPRDSTPRISLNHISLLLGYMQNLVVEILLESSMDRDTIGRTFASWNKLFWIQNDLFLRHYITDTPDPK